MAEEYDGYIDPTGEVIVNGQTYIRDDSTDDLYIPLQQEPLQEINNNSYDLDLENKYLDLERSAELKRKELYRKTDRPLEYNSDGSLETDSDLELRAKNIANTTSKGLDWILEASENILDVGQGDWLDNAQFDAVINGKTYNMNNKDFIAAKDTTLQDLIDQYNNAEYNPNADKAVYTLRKFDGYDEFGNPKYLYKHGVAEVSAADRYKNQWIEDGFEIVDEKRFTGAEQWEKTLHALQESLDSRALDYGMVKDENGRLTTTDKASGVNFGKGYTELYTKNLLGLPDPTQEEAAQNEFVSKQLMKDNMGRPKNSNWVDALQSSTVSMLADFGDFVLDALVPGNSTLLDKWSDSEFTDKYFGFDSKQQAQELEEAYAALKDGDVLNALKYTAIASPTLLAQSIPYMAGMFIGEGEAAVALKAAKIFKGISAAEKAGKSAAYINKLKKRAGQILGPENIQKYEKYKDMPSLMSYGDAFLKNKGLLAVHTAMVEEQLDERVKNKIESGEDPNLGLAEVSAIWLGMLPFTMLDRMAFGDTIKNSGLAKVTKKAFEAAPKKIQDSIITKAATVGAKMLASGSEEAAQEYFQTWGEILGSNLGVNGNGLFDVLGDAQNRKEAIIGGIGGFGAGTLTNAMSTAPNYIYDRMNLSESKASGESALQAEQISDLSNKKIKPFDAEQLAGFHLGIDYENNSDEKRLENFDARDADSFNSLIDTLTNKRIKYNEENKDLLNEETGNAGKEIVRKEVIGNVIRHALDLGRTRVKLDGNTELLNNTIKNISHILNNENIDYSINDLKKVYTDDILNDAVNVILDETNKIDYDENGSPILKENQAELDTKIDRILESIDGITGLFDTIQGSSINIGDSQVEVNDEILNADSTLSLEKIKELLQEYRNRDKTIDDVINEFQTFGFIEEERGVRGQDGTNKSILKWKPSIRLYERNLKEIFLNPNKIKNMIDKRVQKSDPASLSNFTNFALSRLQKLKPYKTKDNIVNKQITPLLAAQVLSENNEMRNLASELESILDTVDYGNKLSDEKKNQIKNQLEATKELLKQSDAIATEYMDTLTKYIEDTLGIKFKDDNALMYPDVRRMVIGHGINASMDENEDEFFNPFTHFTSERNSKNIPGTLAFQKNMLLKSGVAENTGDINLDNLITSQDVKVQEQQNNQPKSYSEYLAQKPVHNDINVAGMYLLMKQFGRAKANQNENAQKAIVNTFKQIKNKIIEKYNENIANKLINDIQQEKDISWFYNDEIDFNNPSEEQKKKYNELYTNVTNYINELEKINENNIDDDTAVKNSINSLNEIKNILKNIDKSAINYKNLDASTKAIIKNIDRFISQINNKVKNEEESLKKLQAERKEKKLKGIKNYLKNIFNKLRKAIMSLLNKGKTYDELKLAANDILEIINREEKILNNNIDEKLNTIQENFSFLKNELDTLTNISSNNATNNNIKNYIDSIKKEYRKILRKKNPYSSTTVSEEANEVITNNEPTTTEIEVDDFINSVYDTIKDKMNKEYEVDSNMNINQINNIVNDNISDINTIIDEIIKGC